MYKTPQGRDRRLQQVMLIVSSFTNGLLFPPQVVFTCIPQTTLPMPKNERKTICINNG
jgi:hypothetical protein